MRKINFNILSIIILFILLFLGTFFITSVISSQEEDPIDVDEVIKEMEDKTSFLENDITAEYSMIYTRPEQEQKIQTIHLHRRDRQNKLLMIFTSPKIDVGKGYLYVDNNLWFYDPSSREFSKKTLSESIGGTDAKTRDMEGLNLSEYFDFEYIEEGKVGKIKCYVLFGTAKVMNVAYPKTKIWIRKDNFLVIKREEYSLSDKLKQTIFYIKYSKIKNKYAIKKLLVVDNKENSKTIVDIQSISLEDLPDNVFTKAYLENQGR